MKPLVNCSSCKGTGKIEVADYLANTLKLLGRKPVSAHDLHDPESTITVNAMNNRLERLRQLGLATRTRVGRMYYYTKATPGSVPANGAEKHETPAEESKPTKAPRSRKAKK